MGEGYVNVVPAVIWARGHRLALPEGVVHREEGLQVQLWEALREEAKVLGVGPHPLLEVAQERPGETEVLDPPIPEGDQPELPNLAKDLGDRQRAESLADLGRGGAVQHFGHLPGPAALALVWVDLDDKIVPFIALQVLFHLRLAKFITLASRDKIIDTLTGRPHNPQPTVRNPMTGQGETDLADIIMAGGEYNCQLSSTGDVGST
mmetsp:Transcript_128362/g.221728  ORF Transcript_128362/g.221728 Transcript_128362/m.221728 type:complete len:206 (+) Transcript_128362:957-1574(+)